MPTVGKGSSKRVFPYTAKGKADAAKARAMPPGKPATPGKAFGMALKGKGRLSKGRGK